MNNLTSSENQIQNVSNLEELLSKNFQGAINAMCFKRKLEGDFSEIVNSLEVSENITEIHPKDLKKLELSKQGQLACDILLSDLKILTDHGASPTLNIIKYYERDDAFPLFPTDVYSFHVDRSPIATDTFLCTYYGAPSEIIPNSQATQKILIPEIRTELKKLYDGPENGFEEFLTENFFDLHYQPKPDANIISLGNGNLWKLAIDHPTSDVLPCLHRAPAEKKNQKRLLLIC